MEVTPELLREARALAEDLGAVEDGHSYYEAADGSRISFAEGWAHPEKVCRVCVLGAVLLAARAFGLEYEPIFGEASNMAWNSAVVVLQEASSDTGGALTEAITLGGTTYVLDVLDEMLERVEDREEVLVGA